MALCEAKNEMAILRGRSPFAMTSRGNSKDLKVRENSNLLLAPRSDLPSLYVMDLHSSIKEARMEQWSKAPTWWHESEWCSLSCVRDRATAKMELGLIFWGIFWKKNLEKKILTVFPLNLFIFQFLYETQKKQLIKLYSLNLEQFFKVFWMIFQLSCTT